MSTEDLRAALASRYRIERRLGAGGMATVHLAHDLRHDRQVAIKILRPELAAILGAERFLAEIRTTANLQHPHILPLFDSGAAGGMLFYVMPFVEGESLRDRLRREHQLPIADAVRLAREVADALDYAHRHGVVHRDIKPENILLHDGRALVADFGIALAATRAGGSRLTETGMSLGTPAYMSPEQATGEREIGPRSDVYALGILTYEMLAGVPPFGGPTAQAIVAKVMAGAPPPLTENRPKVPPELEAAVLVALEKLPADRYGTAAEFAAALDIDLRATPVATTAAKRIGRSNRRITGRTLLTAAGLAVGLAAAFLGGRQFAPVAGRDLSPARLSIIAPRLGAAASSTPGRQLALTPDGDAVVYVGVGDSGTALFMQRLDAADPVEIAGSANLRDPAIAPDGRSILALSPEGGRRLPLAGGTPRAAPLPSTTFVGAWAPDGSYWFTTVDISGITQLTPRDSLVPLALPLERHRGLRIQQVLDDGRTALVVRASSAAPSGPGQLLDLRTGEITTLLEGPILELRAIAGELLVVNPSGDLSAIPFDDRGHRLRGPPVTVATGLALNSNFLADFAVARNGTLAYVREGPPALALVDRSGATQVVLVDQPVLHSPRFAPDGRRVAFDLTTPEGRDVWIYDLERRVRTRVTSVGTGHDASWSPDGRFITFTRLLDGLTGVYRVQPGGSTPPESLFAGPHLDYTGTWLPDGSALITDASDLAEHSGGDLARIANGGRGPLEPLLATPFLERFAMPSPDGHLVAFTSDQTGTEEIYVRLLSGTAEEVQVSQGGGTEPVWAPDGRTLYYRGVEQRQVVLKAAALDARSGTVLAPPRSLFAIPRMVGSGPHANYDISPDGRTFAMVQRSETQHIVVIQDLHGLLRRLRADAAATP